MLSTPDGPFIQVGRLNLPKYAQQPGIARALFEHLFHHANDVRAVSTVFISTMGPSSSFRLFN